MKERKQGRERESEASGVCSSGLPDLAVTFSTDIPEKKERSTSVCVKSHIFFAREKSGNLVSSLVIFFHFEQRFQSHLIVSVPKPRH